jgi:hypothetical protein
MLRRQSARTLLATAWLVGSLALTSSAGAQLAPEAPDRIPVGEWQIAPVLQLRGRGEYRRDLDDRDHGRVLERGRLGLDALRGAVQARVVLQDARVLDFASGDFIEGPQALATTGVYEAWAEAHMGTTRPSFVRVGRQPVEWGEGRLLGISDWSPAGRALDAIRGRLTLGDFAFEALGAVLEDAPQGSGFALSVFGELFGARAEWGFDPLFAVETYALARLAQNDPQDPEFGLQGTVAGQTFAGALRFHGEDQQWAWGAEGAYELGRVDAFAAQRAAWAAAGHVAYAFERAVTQPALRLGAAYATGDRGGSTYRAFDPLLPDVHRWHGAMDMLAWSNEWEVSARLTGTIATDAEAAVEYRYARLVEASGAWRSGSLELIGSAPGNAQAELGHEIDAGLKWSPWVPVELSVGYSVFILGDGARAVLGAVAASGAAPAGPAVAPAGPAVSHYAYGQAQFDF